MDDAIDLIVLLEKVGVVAVHRSVWVPWLMIVPLVIKTSVFRTAVVIVVPMVGVITIDTVVIPGVGKTAILLKTAMPSLPMSAYTVSGRIDGGGRTGHMGGTGM